jgi:hypothetical protein
MSWKHEKASPTSYQEAVKQECDVHSSLWISKETISAIMDGHTWLVAGHDGACWDMT